ncbi:UNVERIFIED_CONTAM: hypothetical protein GTU68_010135, partial [Idotea baltica]|nr:hypothetical protein [Idotea baltica]
ERQTDSVFATYLRSRFCTSVREVCEKLNSIPLVPKRFGRGDWVRSLVCSERTYRPEGPLVVKVTQNISRLREVRAYRWHASPCRFALSRTTTPKQMPEPAKVLRRQCGKKRRQGLALKAVFRVMPGTQWGWVTQPVSVCVRLCHHSFSITPFS